jgi:GrpB-like predicted nucleotidyltransferase (UPF0157 family)
MRDRIAMNGNDALGLELGTVTVVPHDPRWAALFDEASSQLKAKLGSSILDVHHVGSTAVPGLCAKPVLDMLVLIPRLELAHDLVPELAQLGYRFGPEDDVRDRLFFQRRHGTVRTHHLSLAEPSSHYRTVTLAFRDALRNDRALAARYCDLKVQLATQFPTDREAYQNGKTDFVLGTLERLGK